MKIDDVINRVLVENNKHLNKEQVEQSISEGRILITRIDVHDIIKNLPIIITYGNNLHVEITDVGVVVKEYKKDER